MADATLSVGLPAPSKYHDNGDGTYSPAIYNVAGGAGVADRTVTVGLPAPTLYHDNGDGSFSPTIYLTGGSGGFTPDVATAGALIFSTAASKIVPGATSISIQNHANTVSHILITDAGVMTFTPESATGTNTGSLLLGTTSQTQTVPDDTTTINFVCVRQNFNGATNGAVSNSARLVNGEAHWVDNTNDVATLAGGYFFAYNDSTTRDVQDLIGCIGRAYITSTGKSTVGMWGVRGDCNFTGAAASVISAASVVAHQGTWSAAAVITTYSQFDAKSLNCSSGGASVVYGYGLNAQVPTNATSYNVGVNIGVTPVATGPYTIGLNVNTGGAWFRGNATLPVHADTTNTPCIIALIAGNNAAANDTGVLLYFYRSSTALGFFGFDSNVAQVAAGHTKALTDLVIGSDKCLVDTNGGIWSASSISGNSMKIVPAVATSGTMGVSLLYTGAAHTGLTPGSFSEFSFNSQRTVTFDGTGSPTVATAYQANFTRVTYTASAATFVFTEAATVHISGAPVASAAGGFTPTFTNSYALKIDSGAVFLGGLLTTYNNIAVSGNGVPSIVKYTRPAQQTNTTTTIVTYTTPAADGSYLVHVNLNVTTSTTVTMTVTLSYTDETNVVRVLTVPFYLLAGTQVQSITTAQGNIPYSSADISIRTKASTTITVATAGTVTAVVYTSEGFIKQLG